MATYVIIGGVAGGMSAAARLRRLTEDARIIVFERGEYVSFANCGLPYYIGGEIQRRERLLVQTPEAFKRRFNVDVRIESEVMEINREAKSITVKNLKDGSEYTQHYDTLILSPGAAPVKPPIPGIESKKIFTLRNIPDTDKIKNFIDIQNPKKAVVVGGGYIGIEMAENLRQQEIDVTVVEALPQVLNIIDFEMAAIIHKHLKTKGVNLLLNTRVEAFKETSNGITVALNNNEEIESDFVIFSIGVKPETKLAAGAGLKIGERGGISVNPNLRTEDSNIYAIGDAIEIKNKITGKHTTIPLAGPANKQGRMAADNIIQGNKKTFNGSLGTSVLKVFDLTVALTGATEKLLKAENITYKIASVYPANHAGYYPGASQLAFKLLFTPETGRILGAQIVGHAGAEKRVDVISAFIQKEGTISDLTEYEQCYAPPYSSAKDPVNMAAFVAENILTGKVNTVNWDDLEELEKTDCLKVDVRTKMEFNRGTIPDSLHIPVDNLRERLKELPKDKKLIIFCQVGLRGYLACRILMENGFDDVHNLSGGYTTYSNVYL